MDYWFSEQQARLRHLPDTKRALYSVIDWDTRCFGILGARGTGKTTMMLQYLLEYRRNSETALYVSVDHPRFQPESLYEFGREFFSYGGRTLILDEVHKYGNWAGHIKALYDACPELQIIFSGSSILQMHGKDADLSRRALFYLLHGLSFREFLLFGGKGQFPVFDLADVTENHIALARKINGRIKPLQHFRNYLRYGYYPFFLEGKETYFLKLGSVINQVLETDLPMAGRVDVRQIGKLKKLLIFLAGNVPSQLNIQKLSASTEISRPMVYEYLERLQQARLLNLLREGGSGYKILSKPDKVYLENTNLAYALTDRVNAGTVREMFFFNQLQNAFRSHLTAERHPVHSASKGDFSVKGDLIFEIGGKGKGGKQIQGMENAFIAADGIEAGFGRKIPLWLFGFLY